MNKKLNCKTDKRLMLKPSVNEGCESTKVFLQNFFHAGTLMLMSLFSSLFCCKRWLIVQNQWETSEIKVFCLKLVKKLWKH